MFIHAKSKNRPFHWGPFPLEMLPRNESVIEAEADRPESDPIERQVGQGLLVDAVDRYREIYAKFADGEVAAAQAPLPDDLERRAIDIKGAAYFMDASQVGICHLPESAWLQGSQPEAHDHAVVILVEHGRVPETDNLAHDWVAPAVIATAEMRAAELAALVAGHIRQMGMAARAHLAGHNALDLERVAVLAGLALRDTDGIFNPYVGRAFTLAAVSTGYQLEIDVPLAESAARAKGMSYWWGQNGAQSGRERRRRARRPSHYSRYRMETVKRVDQPTTLILEEEVPRPPKRSNIFERALRGDLGEKTRKERTRFAFKHPFSRSQLGLIRSLVPFQDGEVAADEDVQQTRYADPAANAKAVEALFYFLGSDLTGICEIPDYAWYSHKEDGMPIPTYHKYAVVMLIDQGFDTMEGASGDDWISGAQSMRGYLRGAEIAGVMAELLRGLGYPARSQTNADSDVLHLPLTLLSGLGELSRIGELVLNPFVGTLQDRGHDHGYAPRDRQADRFRPPIFLQQLFEMRPRMPVRSNLVWRQGDV